MSQDTRKRIAKNFSSLVISQVVYKIFTFIAMIFIARYLGAEGFGKLSYGISFVWIFLFLADFGLTDIFGRDVAHDRSLLDKYAGNILTLKMVLGAVNIAGIIILAKLSGVSPEKFFIVVILGMSVIFDSLTYFFRFIFRIKEDMLPEGILIILESILKLTIVLFVMYSGFGANGPLLVASALFIVSLLNVTINFFVFFYNVGKVRLLADLDLWFYLLRHASPLMFVYIMSFLNFRIDVILLTVLRGDVDAGLFNADFKLIEQFLLIPVTLASVFFPVFSRHSDSFEKLGGIIKKSVIGLFLLSVSIVAMIYLRGGWFVRFLYGKKFELAGDFIFVMSLVLIPFFIKPVFERVFYVTRQQLFMCKIYLLCVILNIILNYCFIPKWGINGASAATFICESIVAISFLLFYKKLKLAGIVAKKDDLAYPGDQIEKELY